MANDCAQLVIGLALAGMIGGSVALSPVHERDENVAFLERVALAVERVEALAPQTREYLFELTSRHQHRLADMRLEHRRQEALERIVVAMRPAAAAAGVAHGRRPRGG